MIILSIIIFPAEGRLIKEAKAGKSMMVHQI